jgi:hypothetical protein
VGRRAADLALKDKNLTWFRGDLFLRMYVSLYMFTGEWTGETREDGTYVIRTQAYFRNELPPGHFPYPFWHSATKWDAYEKSNQISLYLSPDGKVKMVTRHSGGSDSARPGRVQARRAAGLRRPVELDGHERPSAAPGHAVLGPLQRQQPAPAELDQRYRAFALNLRDADCESCHVPDGHKLMRKLTLLNTPLHTAGQSRRRSGRSARPRCR